MCHGNRQGECWPVCSEREGGTEKNKGRIATKAPRIFTQTPRTKNLELKYAIPSAQQPVYALLAALVSIQHSLSHLVCEMLHLKCFQKA